MNNPPNARIWMWENDGPVKLTLKPGQRLTWSKCTRDEEGSMSQGFSLHWDGATLTLDFGSDGGDCDGRISTSGTLICTADQFKVRTPYLPPDREHLRESYHGIRYPDWQKTFSQRRDYSAELAGF